MHYRAVLFDLDGTLLDTLEDLADATNTSLEAMGYPPRALAEYNYIVGDGIVNMARRSLPDGLGGDDAIVEKLIARMRAQYAEHWADKTQSYDGVPEMLAALQANNVELAVLSNKPDDFTRLMVDRLLSAESFRMVLGAREGVPVKPDPRAAVEIVEAFGIPAGEFLYLGDTNTDMQTANAAGMFAVGALWGFRTAEELKANGAKTLIDHPLQLLDLL